MPELPEVETTVRGLKGLVNNKTIVDVWTDWPKYFSKNRKTLKGFKKFMENKKISDVKRIGKNIIFDLSNSGSLLIHQKMTGHLLFGKWIKGGEGSDIPEKLKEKWNGEAWVPKTKNHDSYFWDPKNRFIRLIFFFKDGNMLALSDMRRFAKVTFGDKKDILEGKDIANLGPDPTNENFKFKNFKDLFKTSPSSRKIKQVLLDQKFLVGIGNIYADEVLWLAKIHPEKPANKLTDKELKEIFKAIKKILKKAIKLKGTSIDDYRVPTGEKGGFADHRKAYQMNGEKCERCGAIIKKMKVGGRGTHYCPFCQVLPGKKVNSKP